MGNTINPNQSSAPTAPANTDELAKSVWQAVRSHHGIKILLSLLRATNPVTKADEIRTLACKALLGLSRSTTVKQILSKLQISQLLSELVREPLLEGNVAIHARFKEHAINLIRSTTGKDSLTPFVADEATDPTARKLEKAGIVASTEIQFSDQELLTLIYEHLESMGLRQSSQTLLEEAKLKLDTPPQPNVSPSKTSAPVRKSTIASAISTSKTSVPIWSLDGAEEFVAMEEPTKAKKNTLETIVTQFLRDQHAHCSHPVAVLPPFPLRAPHRCPEPRNLQKAPTNTVQRLMARQQKPPVGGFGGMKLTRKLIYSRFRYLRVFRDENQSISSASFFGPRGDKLLAGTFKGDLIVSLPYRNFEPDPLFLSSNLVTPFALRFLINSLGKP